MATKQAAKQESPKVDQATVAEINTTFDMMSLFTAPLAGKVELLNNLRNAYFAGRAKVEDSEDYKRLVKLIEDATSKRNAMIATPELETYKVMFTMILDTCYKMASDDDKKVLDKVERIVKVGRPRKDAAKTTEQDSAEQDSDQQ